MSDLVALVLIALVIWAAWAIWQKEKSSQKVPNPAWTKAKNSIGVAIWAVVGIAIVISLLRGAYEYIFAEQWVEDSFSYWGRATNDHLMLTSLTISNTSTTMTIRDPALTCHFLGNSGTAIDEVTMTVYEKLLPGKSVVLPSLEFNKKMPEQATDVKCEVSDATMEFSSRQ